MSDKEKKVFSFSNDFVGRDGSRGHFIWILERSVTEPDNYPEYGWRQMKPGLLMSWIKTTFGSNALGCTHPHDVY
jgi:hypothetical protein